MATDLLIEQRVEDGYRLLDALRERGVSVVAAAWLHASADDQDYLYVVTDSVQPGQWSVAYRTVMEAILAIGPLSFSIDQVRLSRPDEAVGQQLKFATEWLARHGVPVVTGINDPKLTELGFSSALGYPLADRMTAQQVARVVARALETEPPAGGSPVAVIRREQTVVRARLTGLRRELDSGRLVVDAVNAADGRLEAIPADEITDIRVQ